MTRPRRPAPLRVAVMRLPHAQGLALPTYQSEGAAGMDLLAAVSRAVTLHPGARLLVPTGLILALPEGYEAQVRPRSGLAFRHGVSVLNSPGTIDADYRGEVQVLLVNLGDRPLAIARGDRIAQLVVQPVVRVSLVEAAAMPATRRDTGGFGSTGTTATSLERKARVVAKRAPRSTRRRR